MDLDRLIRGSPRLLTLARAIHRRLPVRREHPRRSSRQSVDLQPLAALVNRSEAERLSGIHEKIAELRRIGPLRVVGGVSTGGSDAIFRERWPESLQMLRELMAQMAQGDLLLLYCPHPFWLPVLGPTYQWLPDWDELHAIFDQAPDWTIFQYSPGLDAAGRYFFVASKRHSHLPLPPASTLARQRYRVFYHAGGADLTQGHSSRALSARLCHALESTGATVHSYSLHDTAAVEEASDDDLLIGHLGPWVKEAYDRGRRRIVLYMPVNRWYETRGSEQFEINATIAQQVGMAGMVIAQSGAIWRLTQRYPEPDKWRWLDLGVDPLLFPPVKQAFRPPGRRRFGFVHLYDDAQKGADIARALIHARPTYRFNWIGGVVTGSRNARWHPPRPNTTPAFRRVLSECDFILTPSREDAQPGTVIEAAAVGLLPVHPYSAGYSVSYPGLVERNDVDSWLRTLDYLQAVPVDELERAREAFGFYLSRFHRWEAIEGQILFYLREFLRREGPPLC